MRSFCKLTDHQREVNSCSFSKEYLVTCSGDKTLRVYLLPNFEEHIASPVEVFKYGVNCVTFNANGDLLATAGTSGKAHVFKVSSVAISVAAVFVHSECSTATVCTFSPSSEYLVSGSADGSIALWNVARKKQVKELCGHPEGNVYAAAFTNCGGFLVTGSALGDIRVWDMARKLMCVFQTEAHDAGTSSCGVTGISFSPTFQATASGKNYILLMASCGHDHEVKLWFFDSKDKTLKSNNDLRGHNAPVSSCIFSSNGKYLASASFDKTVIVWDPLTAEQIVTLRVHTAIVTSVSFSLDDRFLASSSTDKSTVIWSMEDATEPSPGISEDGMSRRVSSASEMSAITSIMAPAVRNSVGSGGSSKEKRESAPPVPVRVGFRSWSKEAVANWLRNSLQLSQYADAFKENLVDGEVLASLTNACLKDDLGIRPLGHRNKILRAIKDMEDAGKGIHPSTSVEPLPQPVLTPLPRRTAPPKWQNIQQPDARVTHTQDIQRQVEGGSPDEFLCPISREIMTNPVMAADGYTYQRSAIEMWLSTSSGIPLSPMTNQPLANKTLVPNQTLNSMIQQYLAASSSTNNAIPQPSKRTDDNELIVSHLD